MEYHVNSGIPRAGSQWLNLSDISLDAHTDPALFLGARPAIVHSPNWIRTFARRTLNFKSFRLIHEEGRCQAGSTARSTRMFVFEPLLGGDHEVFEWNGRERGPLQGEVVVCTRTELQIPAVLERIVTTDMSQDQSCEFVTPKYTTDFKELSRIEVLLQKPEILEVQAAMIRRSSPGSFLGLRRVRRSVSASSSVPPTLPVL